MRDGSHKSTEGNREDPLVTIARGSIIRVASNRPKQKEEEEICEIQHKDKIDGSRARQKYIVCRERNKRAKGEDCSKEESSAGDKRRERRVRGRQQRSRDCKNIVTNSEEYSDQL